MISAASGAAGSIDLHLHTTASDGAYSPSVLVDRAARAGIRVLSVTDHDTTAALSAAGAAARTCGMEFVPGIEITAVWQERDVHVLGYYLDGESAPLQQFLEGQRRDRVRRLREICDRLAALGMPLELPSLQTVTPSGHSLGRPLVADALIAAGYVPDRRAAFDRWIGAGRPAFVPRRGASPLQVVEIIRAAGGVASLAHPGLIGDDRLVEAMVSDGRLPAIEVFHPEHDLPAIERYLALARQFDLVATGGSDYHGEQADSRRTLGSVSLPAAEFARLEALASRWSLKVTPGHPA